MSDSERDLLGVVVEVVTGLVLDGESPIGSSTVLTSVMDSFGLLDAILLIEERSGLSVDLAEVQVEGDLTIELLVREVLRLNGL
ncbi:hypothetical protein N9Z54_03010 [Planctomycetota bacterium]|nr:hypothetical protein [Planctomycetota bacterium]